MSEAFVTFRETLEAALIVGILARFAPRSERFYLWAGIITAMLVSLAGALLLHHIAIANAYWEVGISLLAAGMLMYMVVWMRTRSATLSQELQAVAQEKAGWMLFSLSFLAVVREGLETALFLRALWHMQAGLSWAGGLLGILTAALIGLLLFAFSQRVPLRPFFNITSVVLLLIAAGMAAYAVHELLELWEERFPWAEALAEARAWSLFPPRTEAPTSFAWAYTYDEGQFYPPLHHKGWIGAFLQALTGWRATMTWAEVGVWLGTFAVGFWLWRRARPTS